MEHVIAPKLQKIMDDDDFEYQVMRWNKARLYCGPRLMIKGVMAFGKFAFAYFPCVLLIILFTTIKPFPIKDFILDRIFRSNNSRSGFYTKYSLYNEI